jgi:hypothetical protein
VDEVEAVFRNAPRFDFVSKGHVAGENVYWALGQTDAGRYLTIFFIYKGAGMAMPISDARYECKRTEALWQKVRRSVTLAGTIQQCGRSRRVLGHSQWR